MISAVLLSGALLAGNLVTTVTADIIWPPAPKPNGTPQFQTINMTAGNSTTLPFISTVVVDNSTAFRSNLATLSRNRTGLLLASVATANNDTVLLEPIVPPPAKFSKRMDKGKEYQAICEAQRAIFLTDFNMAPGAQISYTRSDCFTRFIVRIYCRYRDIGGRIRDEEVLGICDTEERCQEQLIAGRSQRAWCVKDPNVFTRKIQSGKNAVINVRSGMPSTHYLTAINEYWEGDSGIRRGVENTTFVTSTPDHDRTEIDGYVSSYAQSKAEWMGYDDGWDIYVTPGLGDGWTIIDTSLSVYA